jgi:hypothetical protein
MNLIRFGLAALLLAVPLSCSTLRCGEGTAEVDGVCVPTARPDPPAREQAGPGSPRAGLDFTALDWPLGAQVMSVPSYQGGRETSREALESPTTVTLEVGPWVVRHDVLAVDPAVLEERLGDCRNCEGFDQRVRVGRRTADRITWVWSEVLGPAPTPGPALLGTPLTTPDGSFLVIRGVQSGGTGQSEQHWLLHLPKTPSGTIKTEPFSGHEYTISGSYIAWTSPLVDRSGLVGWLSVIQGPAALSREVCSAGAFESPNLLTVCEGADSQHCGLRLLIDDLAVDWGQELSRSDRSLEQVLGLIEGDACIIPAESP